MVRTMSRSDRAMVRTMVSCVTSSLEVGGAEHGVHRGDVVVLVHGDGPRSERGAGEAELLVRETLQPLVVRDLPAHRLERTRRARVPRDGGADLAHRASEISAARARALVAVLAGAPPARARGRRCAGTTARRHAQRQQGGQRQTTYRVASCSAPPREASGTTARFWSRRAGVRPADRAGSKPSTQHARLKRRIRDARRDVTDSEASSAQLRRFGSVELESRWIRQTFVTLDVTSKVRERPSQHRADRTRTA